MHLTNSNRTIAFNARSKIWLTVAFTAILCGSKAQPPKLKAPDSLVQEVRTSSGNKKVDALNQLAKQTILFSIAEAIPIVNEASKMAKMLHYHQGEADAKVNNALLVFRSGDYHQAIKLMKIAGTIYAQYNLNEALVNCLIVEARYYEYISDDGEIRNLYLKALNVSHKIGRLDLESITGSYFGRYFLNIGDKANAFAYISKAMIDSKKSDNKDALAHATYGMALYYASLKQYPKAISYLRIALKNVSSGNDMLSRMNVYSSIGDFHFEDKKNDSANAYYERALKLAVHFNDAGAMATTYTRMAHIFQEEQKIDSALKYQMIALNLRRNQGNRTLIGSSLTNIGTVYAQKRDYKKALDYYQQGLAMAKETGFLRLIQFSYKHLYDLYLAQKNYERVIHYNLLLSAINDSMINTETQRKFSRIQAKYKSEQKQKVIEFLTKENDIQNLKISQSRYTIYILGALLILIVLIGLLLNRQAKLNALHRQMDNEQKLLRSQMNPHFIFNALVSIQGFIYHNESALAAKYLTRFARLIRLVLANSREEFVSLRRETDMLENYLALQKMRFKNKFDYTFTIDPGLDAEFINIPPMLAQPFLENAIEHGMFGMDKPGHIEVSILERDQNILIQIVDNGNMKKGNLTDEFKSTGNTPQSDALQITRERIRHLNNKHALKITFSINELKDEHNQFEGTMALLVLPEKRLEAASRHHLFHNFADVHS